jgi:transaldolase
MTSYPLHRLNALGQSIWLDDLNRGMLTPQGMLERLIEDDGLSGITSNPSIFEKAIVGSEEYDDQIRALAVHGCDPEQIYEQLTLDDVGHAADLLFPRYEETEGLDGYVSIEVSPKLALDPLGSIVEARRLWEKLDRPNVMIKIPGTPGGLPAIGQLLRDGINVNITLLFSVERYCEVREVFLSALEERLRRHQRIDRIASVASFFLSRIDTLLDPRIEALVLEGGPRGTLARDLLGTIGVSNAKVAYECFREGQETERWQELRRHGARTQRLLWASTSPKSPKFDDLHYVDPLVAPETVTTLVLKTLAVYRQHGRPAIRIADHLDHAIRRLKAVDDLGLSLSHASRELEEEGIRKFVEPYEKVLAAIRRKVGTDEDEDVRDSSERKASSPSAASARPAPSAADERRQKPPARPSRGRRSSAG